MLLDLLHLVLAVLVRHLVLNLIEALSEFQSPVDVRLPFPLKPRYATRGIRNKTPRDPFYLNFREAVPPM